MSRYHNPVRITFASGALSQLRGSVEAALTSPGRVLVLHRGQGFESSPAFQTIRQQLAGYQVLDLPFSGSNPGLTDLLDLSHDAGDFDLVVAIGGGSILDLGKILAVTRGIPFDSAAAVRRMIASKVFADNSLACPWIGIPTTSGTGSEVTPWASVWDREENRKLSFDHPCLFAHSAIIDPELTLSLPLRPTVSTALDALCHATEAYWAKPSSVLNRVHSLAAIALIRGHLESLINDPGNPLLREKIALGSLEAGLAFSATRTTACHSISYPLTLQLGLDHGVATSLSLAAVLDLNRGALAEPEKLWRALGSDSSSDLHDFVCRCLSKAGFGSRLRDYGTRPEDIDAVVAGAFTKGRMDNNPVELKPEDVRKLLEAIQ
jgi:alcohol dehydrogenase class IV